ncbi:MAG: protease modulator HflC [Lachnospiraceae bacterium]|nr:protease modulator HflC [Lachnospiraceae bacterium]
MKNNKNRRLLIVVAAVIALLLIRACMFSVHQMEYVAVRQFGKIVRIENAPGLKLKLPFIQDIQRISAATILYDIPVSDVITKDKKSMIADNYVLWRVTDPQKYIQTLNAVKARADERVEAAVYNATKNVISSMTQDEIIDARGEQLTERITREANTDIGAYGLEVIQSEIKALDLPNDNKEAVYERMISERQNIAASYKAEGEAEAQKIRNDTDRQVVIMKANADKEAQVLEAEGEAEYMRILQAAYNSPEKAEFYNYLRSLDALSNSLSSGSNTIILDHDSEIVKILYGGQ